MAVSVPYGVPTTPWPIASTESEAENFYSREQILAFGPPFSGSQFEVPQGTYYLSRRMWFEGGLYQIKALTDDAATWWIGSDQASMRQVFQHSLGQGTVNGEIYIPRGERRIDIIVQNLPSAPSPCYVIFSLWQNGAPVIVSNADGWVWDTQPIADDDLEPIEDPRLSMPVWTLLPNWKGGILERLSWLTDIMVSESDAEQRRSIRPFPRRSFEVEFLREGVNRSRLDIFFASIGSREFLLPLWHEQVKMLEGVTPDATGVSFEDESTAWREFRTGDIVLVNAGDPDDYELLKVAEVEPTRFGWAVRPKRRWPVGTRIFPCRIARILESPQVQNVTDRVAIVRVRFDLVEPDVRTPSWGEYLPNGDPLFRFTPNRKTPVTFSYSRLTYTLDNEQGIPDIVDWSGQSAINMQFAMTLFGRERVMQFRQMLAAARGGRSSSTSRLSPTTWFSPHHLTVRSTSRLSPLDTAACRRTCSRPAASSASKRRAATRMCARSWVLKIRATRRFAAGWSSSSRCTRRKSRPTRRSTGYSRLREAPVCSSRPPV